MEFWTENHGQPHLNSKFNTVPGRKWAQGHHDSHRTNQYPVYYRDQQDQSNYWAAAGPRSGGKLHDYSHWTDPQLTTSSSHFPFILDHQPQDHKNRGEYQQQSKIQDKEWGSTQRDYERRYLRAGCQVRWEPSTPVCSNREFSAKRSESSYRELEAWAARYSHSLPRRRRLEAELRGASLGLLDSSRAPETNYRSQTNLHETAHVRQNPNRLSGLWDRSPPQVVNNLEMKQSTRYQKMFSRPPGYIAPPPYDNPHKYSPVMQHGDITLNQGGKRQHTTIEILENTGGVKDKKQNETDKEKNYSEVEKVKTQRQETGTTQTVSSKSAQITHLQSEHALPSQHLEVQASNINRQTSSKIIEGRKFKLSKKTGGMTIFCLVSRTVAEPETSSLLLRTSDVNIQSTERREVTINHVEINEISKVDKLADEVDFRSLTQQKCASDVRNLTAAETSSTRLEELGNSSMNKGQVNKVIIKQTNMNNENVAFGRQTSPSAPPVFAKYPLWREPSTTSKTETQSSPISSFTVNTGEKQTDDDTVKCSKDKTKDLPIDTTSVVTKEPVLHSRKEYIHNVDCASIDNQNIISSELNYQLTQDMTTDPDVGLMTEGLDTDLDLMVLENEDKERESEIFSVCLEPSPSSQWETLEIRAERILGISLHDLLTKEKPKDENNLCVQEPEKQTKQFLYEQTQDTAESHAPSKLSKIEDTDNSNLVTNEHGEALSFSDGEVVDGSTEKYTILQLETNKASLKSEARSDSQLKSTFKREPALDDAQPYDLSYRPPDLGDTFSFPALDLNFPWNITDADLEGEPKMVEIINLPLPSQEFSLSSGQLPPSLSSGSPDSLSMSTHHADQLKSPSPLPELTSNDVSGDEHWDEENVNSSVNEENKNFEVKEVSENVEFGQNAESHHSVVAAQIPDEQLRKDVDALDSPELSLATFTETQTVLVQTLKFPQIESGTNSKNNEEHQVTNEESTDSTVEKFETEKQNDTKTIFSPQPIEIIQKEALSYVTEDQSQTNPIEIAGDLMEQNLGRKETTDFKVEKISQDPESLTECFTLPLTLDCKMLLLDELSLSKQPSPPHDLLQSDPEFEPFSDESSISIAESSPPPHQHLCEEATHFSFSSLGDSSLLPPPSSNSTPEQKDAPTCLPPPAAHAEEPQYPKALWDVVSRIRKHTAPDSEDDEEEVCELWDVDSVPEDLHCPDADVNSAKFVYDDTEKDGVETKGHADEDTLSCSSVDSEDTVIVANEEPEETEATEENNEDQCCSDRVENRILGEERKVGEEEVE